MNFRKILLTALISFMLLSSSMVFSQTALNRIKQDIFVLASDSLMGRSAGTKYGDKAAKYIFSRFEENGMKPKYQSIKINSTEKNIYAVIEGSDPILKNEFIIMGAHYDHLGYKTKTKSGIIDTIVYNGADDNASGTSLVLELGRMIAKNKGDFRRSVVIIAFDSEETGLNGSTYFANSEDRYNDVIIAKNTKLMMSLDMVGWLKQSKKLTISGIGLLDNPYQYFNKLNLDGDKAIKFKDFSRSIFTGSDHLPFLYKNIPAFHVTTGIKSPYHKPEDDADLIDCEGILELTNYFYDVVKNLANAEKVETSGKNPAIKKPISSNYWGIELGGGNNQHDYKEGNMTGKKDFAYSGGVFAHISISDYFGFKLGANYNYMSAKRYETRVKYQSVSVPAILFLKLGNNTYAFSVGIGGFFDDIFDSRAKVGEDKYMNYLTQYSFGLQSEIEIRIQRFIFSFQTKKGLTNMDKDPLYDYGKTTQFTTTFKIGYIF